MPNLHTYLHPGVKGMQIRHLPPLLRFIPQFAQICIVFALSKFEANPFFRPVLASNLDVFVFQLHPSNPQEASQGLVVYPTANHLIRPSLSLRTVFSSETSVSKDQIMWRRLSKQNKTWATSDNNKDFN